MTEDRKMPIIGPCKDCRRDTPEKHFPGCQDPQKCEAFAEYREKIDHANAERSKETSARWTVASRSRREKWLKDGNKI